MLREEGLENAWERHRRHHLALKAGLDVLGLSFVVPELERLPQLNSVAVPDGVDDGAVRRRLTGSAMALSPAGRPAAARIVSAP